MKVALISPYSPRKVTGVGTSIIDLCRELKKNQVDFIMMVPEVSDPLPLDSVYKLNSNFFEAKSPKFDFIQNLGIIIFNLRILLKQRSKIDVIHVFSIKSITAAAALLGRILNKPVVSTIYILPPKPPGIADSAIYVSSTSAVLRLTDFFAYETYVARKQCGNRQGTIIPEGIDVNYFKPDQKLRGELRKKLGISDSDFVLLYSGRIVESKGVRELLSAVSALPQSILGNFKLLMIGNIDSESIKSDLGTVSSAPWLIRRPPVERDVIRNYYCAADGFVLPSYYEGISSSLIEAMSCELSPIVTDVGGNVEVVTHDKNGLVVKVKDKNDLREKIEILVKDDKKRKQLNKKARASVVAGFSLEKKAGSYIELYEEMLKKVD
jgi:glycosyltransferase involved in cell wall biosynthesis